MGRLQLRRVSPTVSKCQPRGQLVKANNNETNLIRKNHLDDGDDGDDEQEGTCFYFFPRHSYWDRSSAVRPQRASPV